MVKLIKNSEKSVGEVARELDLTTTGVQPRLVGERWCFLSQRMAWGLGAWRAWTPGFVPCLMQAIAPQPRRQGLATAT